MGELSKYNVESAAKETVKDYVWWRGDGVPEAYYVTAGFSNSEGKPFSVTRTREGGSDKTEAELATVLCKDAMPSDPLRQLCRTTIIRDEWIAALSLELTEMQRFDLVRAALGSIDGANLISKAAAVVKAAEAACGRVEQSYEQARLELSGGLSQLSEANAAAARAADVSAAMEVVDREMSPDTGDLAQRMDALRRDLPNRQRRLAGMNETAFQGRELIAYRQNHHSTEATAKREQLRVRLLTARETEVAAQSEIERAEAVYAIQAAADEIAASLSVLVAHGAALGLHDNQCPLCAANRSSDEFQEGIRRARERIDNLAAGVNAAREKLTAARAGAVEPARFVKELEILWEIEEKELAILQVLEEAYFALFERYDLDRKFVFDLDGMEREASIERDQLVEIERALNALDASRAVVQLASLDSRVSGFRQQVDAAADNLARVQTAVTTAKSLEKSVKRSAGEIVDERLALINPLLNELYQRLRPHSEWRSIEYSIRGDVRRLLSLKVGTGLNPQFVFSSGQRRAAGLAFLLSIHLARPWARWESLLLDDPVQHIDDFRALHLVEVLSALRQAGRQIICAVEDEALGDLMCRRLLSTVEQPGRRFTIDTDTRGSSRVVRSIDILPMPIDVLRPAGPRQAVGE